jgi:hypothetical protein
VLPCAKADSVDGKQRGANYFEVDTTRKPFDSLHDKARATKALELDWICIT